MKTQRGLLETRDRQEHLRSRKYSECSVTWQCLAAVWCVLNVNSHSIEGHLPKTLESGRVSHVSVLREIVMLWLRNRIMVQWCPPLMGSISCHPSPSHKGCLFWLERFLSSSSVTIRGENWYWPGYWLTRCSFENCWCRWTSCQTWNFEINLFPR